MPGESKAFVDAQHGIAVSTNTIAFDDKEAARTPGIHSVPAADGIAKLPLHGRQPKPSDLVVFQHELGMCRTQDA